MAYGRCPYLDSTNFYFLQLTTTRLEGHLDIVLLFMYHDIASRNLPRFPQAYMYQSGLDT